MNTNNKITGIALLLLYVCITTALLNDAFIGPFNLQNLLRYISLFGIIGVGAVFVIITGGIDLSIGSMVGLVGCVLTLTLNRWADAPPSSNIAFGCKLLGSEALLVALVWGALLAYRSQRTQRRPNARELTWIGGLAAIGLLGWLGSWSLMGSEIAGWMTIPVCLILALAVAVHLGWLHGILITKLKLQPFVVTLCGLMCYRGLSRWLASDKSQGFGTKYDESLRLLAIGKPCTATLVLLVGGIALVVWGVFRLLLGQPDRRRSNWTWGVTLISLGAILVVTCSSKYWDGWTTKYGPTLMTIGQTEIQTWKIIVPIESLARPVTWMRFAVYPLVAAAAVLLVAMSHRLIGLGRLRVWFLCVALPALLSALSLGAIYRIKSWIGDQAVMLGSTDPSTLWKMVSVFAAMGGLMLGISIVASSAMRSQRPVEQVALAVTAFFSVLWLLGFTAIHNTNVQVPFFFLIGVGLLAGVFLNQTIYGRYLFALGRNEEAARYSGIKTDRMVILAYMICAACAGLGGILFTLDSNNVEPSGHGSFYELYAIAAAVLGGCSLRGGEGSIVGVILGAAIMRVLFNAPNMIGVSQQLELFTMGVVILTGVIADEQIRRFSARRSGLKR